VSTPPLLLAVVARAGACVIVEVRGDLVPSFSYPAANVDERLSAPDGGRRAALTVLDVAPVDGNGRSATEARMSIFP
jgi:hypothetical protein